MTRSFKLKSVCIFALAFLLACRDNQPAEPALQTVVPSVDPVIGFQPATAQDSLFPVNLKDSVNYIDKNGWKQGLHLTKGWMGAIVQRANYVNDTMQGYFWEWDGHAVIGNMVDGKREGIFNHYYNDTLIMTMMHYENDQRVWSACYAANVEEIRPIKDFHADRDSVWIRANHPNGERWYNGLFLHRVPYGVHEVYDTNGKLRGTITYPTEIDSTKPWYQNFMEYTVTEVAPQ